MFGEIWKRRANSSLSTGIFRCAQPCSEHYYHDEQRPWYPLGAALLFLQVMLRPQQIVTTMAAPSITLIVGTYTSKSVSSPALSASYASSATKSSSNSNGGTIHITTRRNIHIEKRIEELKMELPTAPLPKANYNIICLPPGESVMYVSGHLPIKVRLYYVHACVERNAICYGKSDV